MVEMYDKKMGECMDNEEFKQWIKPQLEERDMSFDSVKKDMRDRSRLKDSGARSEFSTGAVRDLQVGKGRMDLLPIRALMSVADIMERGACKYDARNWEKGIPLSRFVDSGLRHLFKWLIGCRDEPHLAQTCWNFLCLLDTQLRIEEGVLPTTLNDLPCNQEVESLKKFDEDAWNDLPQDLDEGYIEPDLFGNNWEEPIT